MVVFDGALHLAMNTGNYNVMTTAEVVTLQTVPASLFATWRGYLYRADGADVYYTNATGGVWSTPAIQVGEASEPITGMAGMGDVDLYCAKTDGLYYIGTGDFVFGVTPWPTRDADYGKGMIHHAGDLYIPLGASLIRVTSAGQILSMGFDQGEGLPTDYAGSVRALASVSNYLFAYVYGADGRIGTNVGSVWAWNGQGWHHLATTGEAMGAAGGMLYDRVTARIWVGSEAGFVAYVPIAAAADNPIKSALSRYAAYGWLETPRFTGGLMEVAKDVESVYLDGDFPTGTSVDVYLSLIHI